VAVLVGKWWRPVVNPPARLQPGGRTHGERSVGVPHRRCGKFGGDCCNRRQGHHFSVTSCEVRATRSASVKYPPAPVGGDRHGPARRDEVVARSLPRMGRSSWYCHPGTASWPATSSAFRIR
jgi:hypothetical protein